MKGVWRLVWGCVVLVSATSGRAEILPPVTFKASEHRVEIRFNNKPLATYVHHDAKIPRPYFAHVHAPNAVQVTRNHPPVEGKDATDHATFHPGIWMAFGDLSDSDNWRLKARVEHAGFVDEPVGKPGYGRFAVRNRYLANDGKSTICTEVCRYEIIAGARQYWLIWDSQFTAGERGFYFGDQEEMGLGVRVTTPITAKNGGSITNAEGFRNEPQVWGKQSDWCAYRGEVDGQTIGIAIMPDPGNFRRSWFHARDYGFVAANPFGVNAFTRGPKSKITVAAGDTLQLRYAVLLYAADADSPIDLAAAYRECMLRMKNAPREDKKD